MFQLDLGRSPRYCDGLNRRSFLKIGVAGMAAVGLPELLRARAENSGQRGAAKNTRVILIWLDGGPGHMDLYDMKPDAPVEYRGLWKPIRTRVPGFDITEMFPLQAQVTDKFSMVRSLHCDTNDHLSAAHRMLTTKDMGVNGVNREQRFPSIGAFMAREAGPRQRGLPAYVVVPKAVTVGSFYFGGHMIGAQYNPFQVPSDRNTADFNVPNLNLAKGLTIDKLEDRRYLVRHFDDARKELNGLAEATTMDRFATEAYEFVTGSAAREAFAINKEDPKTRDRYGRHTWGQSTLLARRLAEAGCTFVTVNLGGWDHHWDLKKGYDKYLPMVDRAVASLFEDLDDRGLLATTLVVLCGEFSRTPKMNDGAGRGTPGRDHWGQSMFCLMGGGGVKGGQVVGSTDRLGTHPNTRPLTPCNIHATIYEVLGIDPRLQVLDPSGRPTNVVEDPTPISELL
jgi:hypothetical protein